jgi:hypothetical protein
MDLLVFTGAPKGCIIGHSHCWIQATGGAMRNIGIACVVLLTALITGSGAIAADNDCKNDAYKNASVDIATNQPPQGNKNQLVPAQGKGEFWIGSKIYLHIVGLADLQAELLHCRLTQPNKQLVLYLDGLPMTNLTGAVLGPPEQGIMEFVLSHATAKEAWARILGSPLPEKTADLRISIGYADQFPISSTQIITLNKLPSWWYIFFLGFAPVLAIGIALIWLGLNTALFRDGTLADGTPAAYSLARTQAAWWLFFVVSAFVLIAAVTGDFNGTLNGTALTLLGIGGATAAGSAVVGASKQGEQHEAVVNLQQKTDDQLQSLQAAQRGTTPPPANLIAAVQAQIAANQQMLVRIKQPNAPKQFLTDILSDADGISIHRFQLLAWTLVLTVIFAREVWEHLGMPDFDGNLLALQGISSATYVGLKMAEPSVPKEAKK